MINRWAVFGVGVVAYAVAIMHRASLGVAGREAADHFGTTPSIVSTFVVLQLVTYALAQVPVGVILDRVGARVMIAAGSVLMALGQFLLGSVDVLALAFVARVMVGLGDACIYISMLGLIPRWFPPERVPLMSQLTGMLSVAGQLSAIYGLLPLIQGMGWRGGLYVAATLGLVMAAASFAVVRSAPPGTDLEKPTEKLTELHKGLWSVISHPGTQLGFFVHFTSGFSINAFLFMWGLPYLQGAQGLSQEAASTLFMLISVAGLVVGPVLGILTARHPLRRSNLALTIIWCSLATWVLVLVLPGPAPLWLLVVLSLCLAAGGPGTAVGFDFPRTTLPTTRLGVANGIVISGAFLGGTLTILLVGVLLSLQSGGASTYTFGQWQWAMAVQTPIYLFGLAGIYVTRKRLRRRMAEAGVIVPKWPEVARRIWRKYHR